MQHTVWWAQCILNVVRQQQCAPYAERGRAKKNYHTATDLLRLNQSSVFELRGATVLCNVEGSGTAAGKTRTCRTSTRVPRVQNLFVPLERFHGIRRPRWLGAEAPFLFRNKAVRLFRTKCLISKLHLNINKIRRQLGLHRKMFINSLYDKNHYTCHSINMLYSSSQYWCSINYEIFLILKCCKQIHSCIFFSLNLVEGLINEIHLCLHFNQEYSKGIVKQ